MLFHPRRFVSFVQAALTPAPRPTKRRLRLAVERLEDRIALSTFPAPSNVWTAIGPAPITGNTSDGGTITGRVTSIATDPSDPTGNTVYIGTAGGGVWKGTNINSESSAGGDEDESAAATKSFTATWTPLTDNLAAQLQDPYMTLSVGAVATVKDPQTGNTVIYAGMGEANAVSTLMTPSEGATQFYGAGMIKSTDGGQSWSLLGGPLNTNMFYRLAFSKIVTVPNDPDIVYAAVATAKNGLNSNEGIYVSTDGGQNWTNATAHFGLPSNEPYTDLVLDPSTYGSPQNQQVLYAAIGDSVGNAANGVYMSTDGGTTWAPMTGSTAHPMPSGVGVGRITLAISPTSIKGTTTNALYAAFMATNKTTSGNGVGTLTQLGYVKVAGQASDTGLDWNVIVGELNGDSKNGTAPFLNPDKKGTFNYVGTQGYYGTSLIVNPFDASEIFAGGQDHFLDIQGALDSTSSNPAFVYDIAAGSGPDSTQGNPNPAGDIHVDHHGIAVAITGTSTFTVLDGNDGGVFNYDPQADNGNGAWFNDNTNLQISQIYGIAANPNNTRQIYAALQDNGNATTLGTTTWQAATNGDGSQIFIDPTTNPETVYLTQTAAVYSNTADPFQPTTPPNLQQAFAPLVNQPGIPNGYPGNFPAVTYAMQRVNGTDYLWYGGADANGDSVLFLSTNGGQSWQQISFSGQNGWFTMTNTVKVNGFVLDNTVVDSIGVVASDPNTIYVGVRGGHLLVTHDGLAPMPTWTELDPVQNPGSAQVDLRYNQILVDPYNSSIAYVVAANFGDVTNMQHVWMTTNAGQSWIDITNGLPDVPTWSIQAAFPTVGTPSVLYVGNDVGLFVSQNGGASWANYGTGLPSVQVRNMDLVQNPQNPSQNVLLAATFGRGAYEILPVPPTQYIAVGAGEGGGPEVQVYDVSSGTPTLKFDFFPFNTNFTGGVRVAVGDVNGDGVPDIICAAGPGGGPQVNVYNGVDGTLMYSFFAFNPSFMGGVYVAAGDLSGTGHADIIAGAGSGGGPQVNVFNGPDGSLLSSFFAYNPAFAGGVRVAAGDTTGDGKDNIITGAGPGGGPNVTIFSGTDDSVLSSFFAYNPSFTAGIYVAAGDVNGDGKDEIITGAGAGGGPNVMVFGNFTAADATPLLSFFAYSPGFTNGVRVAGGSGNGGSQAAVFTVPGGNGGPEVNAFSGLNGSLIDSFFAFDAKFSGGLYVAGTGH
jgi:hypothetical protein